MSTPIELPAHVAGDWWEGIGPITYKINGVGVNLTNAQIRMHIKKDRKAASTAVLSWSTLDNTIIINDAVNGVFTIIGRVLDIPSGKYLSDVEVIAADAKPRTIIREIVWTILPDITR